jgi:hypothetical protein
MLRHDNNGPSIRLRPYFAPLVLCRATTGQALKELRRGVRLRLGMHRAIAPRERRRTILYNLGIRRRKDMTDATMLVFHYKKRKRGL